MSAQSPRHYHAKGYWGRSTTHLRCIRHACTPVRAVSVGARQESGSAAARAAAGVVHSLPHRRPASLPGVLSQLHSVTGLPGESTLIYTKADDEFKPHVPGHAHAPPMAESSSPTRFTYVRAARAHARVSQAFAPHRRADRCAGRGAQCRPGSRGRPSCTPKLSKTRCRASQPAHRQESVNGGCRTRWSSRQQAAPANGSNEL